MRIFISYGHDCTEFVQKLCADLEAAGHDVWMDVSRLQSGSDWRSEIADGITQCQASLIFLSRHSLKPGSVCLDEMPSGWLLLSFPNQSFEILNPDGTNRDPFHLHVLDRAFTISELERMGFCIHKVLGQPVTNILCTRQHDLKVQNLIRNEEIDKAFRYDDRSIRALARLMAWPQEEDLENSYSYLVVAQKDS